MTITQKGAKKLEIAKDGSITVDGKLMMKIVKNTIQDEQGRVVLAVDNGGNVVGPELKKKVSFNDKNDLVFPEGGTMVVGKDGSMSAQKDKKTEKFPLKFTGVNDKNHRTAVLLGMMTLMAQGPESGPPEASPTAQPPATTTAKPPQKK